MRVQIVIHIHRHTHCWFMPNTSAAALIFFSTFSRVCMHHGKTRTHTLLLRHQCVPSYVLKNTCCTSREACIDSWKVCRTSLEAPALTTFQIPDLPEISSRSGKRRFGDSWAYVGTPCGNFWTPLTQRHNWFQSNISQVFRYLQGRCFKFHLEFPRPLISSQKLNFLNNCFPRLLTYHSMDACSSHAVIVWSRPQLHSVAANLLWENQLVRKRLQVFRLASLPVMGQENI